MKTNRGVILFFAMFVLTACGGSKTEPDTVISDPDPEPFILECQIGGVQDSSQMDQLAQEINEWIDTVEASLNQLDSRTFHEEGRIAEGEFYDPATDKEVKEKYIVVEEAEFKFHYSERRLIKAIVTYTPDYLKKEGMNYTNEFSRYTIYYCTSGPVYGQAMVIPKGGKDTLQSNRYFYFDAGSIMFEPQTEFRREPAEEYIFGDPLDEETKFAFVGAYASSIFYRVVR